MLDENNIEEYFMELAGRQRLEILTELSRGRSKITQMAKKIDATTPEIHRNFERLEKAGFVEKNDGLFSLSPLGRHVLSTIPSFIFLKQNKKYFETHGFGDLPDKFVQRVGALKDTKHIKGFVKVQENSKQIYENAKKYVYNVLFEVQYSSDFMDLIFEKTSSNVLLKTIFAENSVIPDERKKALEKSEIKKLIQDNTIERKMRKQVTITLLMNEKEAAISFPFKNDNPDVSEMFFGNSSEFHEFVLDYFKFLWEISNAFNEKRLQNI